MKEMACGMKLFSYSKQYKKKFEYATVNYKSSLKNCAQHCYGNDISD